MPIPNNSQDFTTLDESWIDYSISFTKANIIGVIFPLPFMILATGGFVFFHNIIWITPGLFIKQIRIDYYWFLLAILGGVILHELLHGITWIILSRTSFRNLKFGFHWPTLSPFAHLKIPIRARAYRFGSAIPMIVLGFIPCIVAIVTGSVVLLLCGLLFILGAGGDAAVLWIIKNIDPHTLVMDHPTRVGCYVKKNIDHS